MNSYPGLVWSAEFDGAAVRLTRRRKDMTEEEIVAHRQPQCNGIKSAKYGSDYRVRCTSAYRWR
jgi:hypothetical protein